MPRSRVLTVAELTEAIAEAREDLQAERDPAEAEITRRDLRQLLQQRRDLRRTWVPTGRQGTVAAKILTYLAEHGEIDPVRTAQHCKVPIASAHTALASMSRAGQVQRVGRGRYQATGAQERMAAAQESIRVFTLGPTPLL